MMLTSGTLLGSVSIGGTVDTWWDASGFGAHAQSKSSPGKLVRSK